MLVQAILRQLSLDLDLSVERDLKRISDRCEHEGLSFLTITLPQLDDALLQGIEAGTFTCPLLSHGMEVSPVLWEVSSNVCSIQTVGYSMSRVRIPLLVYGKFVASSRS